MATCSDRADSEVSFAGAIAFSLEKLCLPDVSLKAEQCSAIKVIYEGRDVFPYGLWEEHVLPDSTLRYGPQGQLCLYSSLLCKSRSNG